MAALWLSAGFFADVGGVGFKAFDEDDAVVVEQRDGKVLLGDSEAWKRCIVRRVKLIRCLEGPYQEWMAALIEKFCVVLFVALEIHISLMVFAVGLRRKSE